ncbi:MAG TPA: hypothetical protein VLM75_05660 [Spirochaetota bacterium]|nr:hypothetical protein [Spirochaetota bacterium]
MSTTNTRYLPALNARATIIIPALLFALTACGSYKTVRITGDDGRLREIHFVEKGVVTGRISLEYDAAGRLSKASRLTSPGGETLITRTFSYDQTGRLRIQSHRAREIRDGSSIDDAWVESFFYGSGGDLVRTETSFKSSHSIARNRTPLVITRFSYIDGILVKILVDGTVFRREVSLAYRGKELSSVEMLFLSPVKSRQRLKSSRHLLFTMDGGRPSRAEDRLAGTTIKSRDEARLLFAEHGLDALIETPGYAASIQDLPGRLASLWGPK